MELQIYCYAFGMTRQGFEPAISRSRSGRSTTELSGPVMHAFNMTWSSVLSCGALSLVFYWDTCLTPRPILTSFVCHY